MPKVIFATPAYRDRFEGLLSVYLYELREAGSEIRPTDRTFNFWMSLFDAYVDGSMPGVVLLSVDETPHLIGFSMAGAMPLPYDTDFGNSAFGWGTFVLPLYRRERIGSELRESLMAALEALGFDTVLGGVHISNRAGLASLGAVKGFTPHQVVGYARLRPVAQPKSD